MSSPLVCQDNSIIRSLSIDPMVGALNPPSAKLSLRVRRVTVVSRVEITRCGHIERMDLDKQKSFLVPKNLPLGAR